MTHSASRKIIAIVVALSVLTILAVGQESTPALPQEEQNARSPYFTELDRLVAMMAEIVDQVRETYYAAALGCNSDTQEELEIHAQVVMNLLEGLGSPLYDDSIEIPSYALVGMLPIVDSFEFTQGWFDPEVTSQMQKKQLEDAYGDVYNILYSASMWLQHILTEDSSYPDMRSSMEVVCQLFDILEVNIEGFLGELGYEIWLRPETVLQEAIDNAREGATIYLWPRTYTESLTISKNLTIDGSYVNLGSPLETLRIGYSTTIEPEPPDVGFRVHGESGIVVTLRQMTIKSATQALVIEGDVQMVLEEVTIVDAHTGEVVDD
ncbi:hypothetical protein ACFLSG_01405 [Candidatus Bipolaricaulota bacterium]